MKNQRGFIAGMLTMLLIVSLAGTASARVAKITKELEYRDIKVSLDGEVLDLRDVQGNPVEPFMFDGTNYLPVRALAESLGLSVAWDGSTATVVLTRPTTEQVEESAVDVLLGAQNHVRFYFTGLEKRSDGGYDFKIRCENDSDHKIFAYTKDFTINGSTILSIATDPCIRFDCTVDPGRTINTVITVDKEALDKYKITEIKRFKTGFAGYDVEQSGWSFDMGGQYVNLNT